MRRRQAPPLAVGEGSAPRGTPSAAPQAGVSVGSSVFSVPSVLPASVNSVLIPGVSVCPSSTNRAASASSRSSSVIVTSANPIRGRFVLPLKMQSAIRSARSDLWLCSPRTHQIASTPFDFPQPFGPTMQVVPVPLNVTTVRSQNDLKPTISTFRSLSKVSPFVPHRTARFRLARHSALRNRSFIPCKRSFIPRILGEMLRHTRYTLLRAKRNQCFVFGGRNFRRPQPDRYALTRKNAWQVLDQSPAAWRVNGA